MKEAPVPSDLSEIEALNSTAGRSRCSVGDILDTLDAPDRALLEQALLRPWEGPGKVEHAAIAKWLDKKGIRGPVAQTIGRHRSRQCSCWRAAA